jgi:hypothetical protein
MELNKLQWSKDTDYWLKNSIPLDYQNQTSAWFLGGEKLVVNGFGHGTLDGNGQVWYDLVKGESNYPRTSFYCCNYFSLVPKLIHAKDVLML